MSTTQPPPTTQAYHELQTAFAHFNQHLFDNTLPECLITLQRQKNTLGYFSKARFAKSANGTLTDEIAMHPGYFATRPIQETLSTLVHEMVHLWQGHFGKSGRRGYHNKQWAKKMEAIGLMPSHTAAPDGKRVGDQMSHYIMTEQRFDMTCQQLLTNDFTLSWIDRFPPVQPGSDTASDILDLITLPEAGANRSNRVKYQCDGCGMQVWGKPNLSILCGEVACDKASLIPHD